MRTLVRSMWQNVVFFLWPVIAWAQNDLGGHSEVSGIDSPGFSDEGVRTTVLNVLSRVLAFVGLIMVVVIVIAGIILIVSGGDDGQKDRAKKIIIYAIVGVVIIILSSAFVAFLINVVS